MPPAVVVLLSLLLGTLAVSAVPVEKGEHPEEMVTRCIVEVLSNALAKPNAPAIDPECQEILKKSSRHSQDEKDNEIMQYEARHLKELSDKQQHEITQEIKQQNPETEISKEQNEEKRHHMESESREEKEENEGGENHHVKEKEEGIGHSKEKDILDDDEEERGKHKDYYQSEEIIKKDKKQHDDSAEGRHAIVDMKVHTAAKSAEEFSEEDEEEPRHLKETMKRRNANKSWREHLNHPEKHPSTHSYEVSEESDESEDEEEKRSYKPKHNELAQRFHGYEETRSHHGQQRNPIESKELNEDETYSRGQKRHYGLNSFEDHVEKNDYEKRAHHEIRSSDESKEKRHLHRGSEEQRERRHHSEESNERESKRHHFEEKEEKRHHDERKRWPKEQNEEARFNYEQSKADSKESEEDIDKRHAKGTKEKDTLYTKNRQDSEEEGPHKYEEKEEDKRHYIGEEMLEEVKRHYPEHSEEQEKRHKGEEFKYYPYGENIGESNYLDNEKYKSHHSEEERRPETQHGSYDDQLKWKNRYFNKEEDNILGSEEENKHNLQSKNVFPEYNDYDWLGKRQFLEDVNHGYGEKQSPPRFHKFDMKRQYDRMDKLAQLLNYKKKSVEFPDFYDSEEIKKRHLNERGSLSKRPLTEEEEKELENLAIMDLELQKIAEKLSNSRQG
ncbi:hypothetical protein FKM82_010358 [Ascaphus truei]